ncbi:MAG: Gfo/Idh/MocA family oxidoreductase [Clostridiales bacterium]|nr:Gfo/Idh/MocA family oxidoreductase [Clostridiales bacterium]
MINVGIIGCGKVAQVRHLPEYADNKNVKIAGLFDLNMQRAEELAGKYGAKAYGSYAELLADPAIDAVSVCSSNNSHAEIAIAALKAGKHVLCEKPMATTLADCEEMVRMAEECGKYLMIGQNQRLAAAHVKAKELIDAGEIGRIISFETAFRHGGPETWSIDPGANTWFFDKKRAAMGAMADLGIHKTDLVQFLIGQEITEVSAQLSVLDKKFSDGSPITVDDNAVCIFRMDGGCVGTMQASWTNYGPEDNSTILYGTEGVMRIYDDPAHSIVLNKKGGETLYFDVDEIQTNDNQTKSGVIDLFVSAIMDPAVEGITGKSVLPAMRAIFAAIESSEKGCCVKIEK